MQTVSLRQGLALGALAMLAFAANSLLARLALAEDGAGAWGFSLIRILSGALVLALLVRRHLAGAGSWQGAVSLLVYVAGFSFAYLALDAGLGALVLFASVQLTMIGWALVRGDRLGVLQWSGLALASAALVWLLSPGGAAPPPLAVAAMLAAGIGWGAYSLIGRSATQPTAATAGNFLRAGLIALALTPVVLVAAPEALPSGTALLAAVASGALASGLGYAIWYGALPGLGRAQAGALQLSVPPLAALGGTVFLNEPLTARLVLATLAILAGIGLVLFTARDRS